MQLPTIHRATHIGGYRLVQPIGAGGMGEVWLAEHTLLGRRAAIKVLHPEYSRRPDVVTRFFNEARAATAIADPGIIQIFDFGRHTDGSAYIVMELLEGESLDARCRRPPALTLSDALRIVRQVASSLGAAHQRGIVHRDLKPENIFLVRDPEVAGGERAKVLDFGIAKLNHDAGLRTQTSEIIGTPAFMSPEQCRGAGRVDQRSDVYSLGCVLFAILTGHAPFEAEGTGELIVKHLTHPAPRASSRVAVPPAVDDLIARCLEKDPDRRFSSGTELAAEITAVLARPSVITPSATARLPAESGAAIATTLSGASAAISAGSPQRRRRLAAVSILLSVVAGGVVTLWSAMQRAPSTAPLEAMTAPPEARDAPAMPAREQPKPPPTPPEVDWRPEATRSVIRDVLVAFISWSERHAGSPCPTLEMLVVAPDKRSDAWGHELSVTCTEQSEEQKIGIASAGPDGHHGTSDDMRSWELGADMTQLVHGPRWLSTAPRSPARSLNGYAERSRRPASASPTAPPADHATSVSSPAAAGSASTGSRPSQDGAPVPPNPNRCRDANDLPSCR